MFKKRCDLHNSQQIPGKVWSQVWIDIFIELHQLCQDALLIEDSVLLDKLNCYMKKRDFCIQCRKKLDNQFSNLLKNDGNDFAID